MKLGTLDLTDNLIWTDEFAHNQLAQSQARSVLGGLLLQHGQKHHGRPLTLTGWLPRATVDSLVTLEASAAEQSLTLDDEREFTVVFDRSRGIAIQATPIRPQNTEISQDSAAWYSVTLRLLTVEPPPAQP